MTATTDFSIPERLFQILLLLLKANGDVVSRAALASSVWGSEGVTDTNLSQHIYMLRVLLNDRSDDQSYIRTVVGQGYRFARPIAVTLDEAVEQSTTPLTAPGISDREAEKLRLYSLGCVHLERRTASSLRTALGSFESALRLDDRYHHALIGIARANLLLAQDLHVPPAEVLQNARKATLRATELAPSSSTAFAMRSEIALFADWNWTQAQREVDAAIRLNPTSIVARNCAALLYALKGDADIAISEARRLLMLQPGSPGAVLLVARVLTLAGRYSEAVDWLTGLLAIAPEFNAAKGFRATAQVLDGRYEAAITDMQASNGTVDYRMPLLVQAYAGLGDQPKAEEAYSELCRVAKTRYVAAWNLAIAAAGLGRGNEAIAFLERAHAERECAVLSIRRVPWFKALEESPTVRQIIHMIDA